jgi:serine/threonine-protein kinase
MKAGDVVAGKYRLDVVLGEGAMGVVWRATQLDLDREVAVKVLHASQATRGDARARFVREAKVAAALDHPGAVHVLDFGEHHQADGELYLVMDLLVGDSLRDRLDDGPLPIETALDLATQVARVLEAAHRLHLVHRDIKPGNIFLEDSDPSTPDAVPRAIVVDFGLAFIADVDSSVGRLTDAGILGGTPAYMSPEQARGKAVGPASDIYSLGCTLYEMCAGRPPFVGAVADIIARHAHAPTIPLRDLELASPPPAAVDALVTAMLSKSPLLRPTATQVVEQLTAMAPGPRALRTIERSARLHGVAVATPEDALDDETTMIALAVEGDADEDLRLALATSAIRVTAAGDSSAAAVYAPGATIERLAALAAEPRPLITDVERGDFTALAERVRAGCRDAVTRPVRAAELARKVRRAWLATRARP